MAGNDLNTNPLYQDVASTAADVKSAYSGLPTFQDSMQQGIVGQDVGLQSALGGYTDSIAQLFAHDKSLAASNMGTIGGASQEDINPMIQEKYSADLFAQKGQRVADSLKIYETRKNMLGSLVDKAVKIYENAIAGKKFDYEAAKDIRDTANDLYKFGETQKLGWAQLDAKKTASNTGIKEIDGLDDTSAVSALKQMLGNTVGSNEVLGGTGPERGQRARDLLASMMRGKLTINEILTPKENESLNEALASKTQVASARNIYAKYKDKGVSGGTGFLPGILPTKVSSGLTQQLRAAIGEVNTKMQKFYSGVAISAQEMQRLEAFLPSKDYDEAENYRRLTKLENGMTINQKIFEAARLSGKTVDEVLNSETGRKIFEENGENYPYVSSSVPKYNIKVKQQ